MGLHFLITPFILTAVCAIIARGKVYERCELARELRDVHEIPDNQLATWVCIARHESEYNTSAINRGSGDHGLLQISELFWCSPPGYACGVSCDDLRNDDIEDDVICARRVYREHKRLSGDGFNAWVVYGIYCRDKQYADTFLRGCFKPGILRTSEDIQEKPLPTVNYYPQFNKKTTSFPTTIQTTKRPNIIQTTGKGFKTTSSRPISSTTKKRVISSETIPKVTSRKPTQKTTKLLTTISRYITEASNKEVTTKPPPIVTTTAANQKSVSKMPSLVQTAQIDNQGKPLRATEENDEFTYAISKTGYKFTRF